LNLEAITSSDTPLARMSSTGALGVLADLAA
jgi:hypothetical protein